ncbi:hypothetical protein ABB37_06904 [Leptomonas pyrrhocoris]|uniref:Transmembrane protein n=1 Tax=Leptomonas pyrrhocoris TaxID=157538 RepID=A0A0N0DTJ6_LEPPY|nr:hypothetical protein ABB37_06904 [Leptomonas pyrrhocoris]XP_015655962.1 hypothetical protein ABB37_06904 [Leptomonas pyrrhocoris]KPA77522.1 hypothetical protein ABB37_06904 [Leptomonas pyrrhocoris]KPA77523.1 hypothetical protein ABB37_06904 [Leptomonas pyrrhocoris]|eukprot:XP_015655961.1 hypothetical protein ABB37_06904 [Leptomonas pyrrhocoris]
MSVRLSAQYFSCIARCAGVTADACAARRHTAHHCTDTQRRCMTYSTFGAMRKKTQHRNENTSASSPPTHPGASSSSSRPLQSSVQSRKEAEMAFPKTLKSGRPAQQNTVSQQLFYANTANALEMAQQRQRDREYAQQMRELHSKRGAADRRFFRRSSDYRDIQDADPYAAIFGESGGTQRLRTAAWQRQFEKENEKVELPYERTNVMARLAPNFFVRYFVNLRDNGGADHLYLLWTCAFTAVSSLALVGYLFYTPPSRARPTSEIR